MKPYGARRCAHYDRHDENNENMSGRGRARIANRVDLRDPEVTDPPVHPREIGRCEDCAEACEPDARCLCCRDPICVSDGQHVLERRWRPA